MWMKGSRSRLDTPAKARRTGNPSPSKPLGAVVTDFTGLSRSGAVQMNLRSQIDSLRARAEQRERRMQQLTAELTEVENALEAANAGNRAARGRLEEAVAAMAELEDRRVALEAEREVLRARLSRAIRHLEADMGGTQMAKAIAAELSVRADHRIRSSESGGTVVVHLGSSQGHESCTRSSTGIGHPNSSNTIWCVVSS